MKIAIASDDKKTISSHFGKTKGFVIFEVENEKIKNQEYRPNTFTGHARGLEHDDHEIDRHTPILNALKDCKAVITHGMGKRIYDDLKEIGIDVFITDETDVETAFELYVSGKLIDKLDMKCLHEHN